MSFVQNSVVPFQRLRISPACGQESSIVISLCCPKNLTVVSRSSSNSKARGEVQEWRQTIPPWEQQKNKAIQLLERNDCKATTRSWLEPERERSRHWTDTATLRGSRRSMHTQHWESQRCERRQPRYYLSFHRANTSRSWQKVWRLSQEALGTESKEFLALSWIRTERRNQFETGNEAATSARVMLSSVVNTLRWVVSST